MTPVGRLTFAAYGIHMADQIALVAVPLVAALLFDASAQMIGILVACQSLAHLVGSLPLGILVDNTQQRTLAIVSSLISVLGFAGASLSIWAGSLFWFGLTVTFAGFGVVLFVLTALSILPKAVAPDALARANAAIEVPRALSSFAAPLVVGIVVSGTTANWLFLAAALGAIAALVFTLGLPEFPVGQVQRSSLFRHIRDGGVFVLKHELLLPISLCALFWNLAFSGLFVVMVPMITKVYLAAPGTFGVALSAFGLAAVAGSWTAGKFAARFPPNLILLFGPGSSVLAVLGLCAIPANGPAGAIYALFFLLGFGPSMWLIVQNSVRQLVTPSSMPGRVNAVIQTAIYGIRPLGALIVGAVVAATSPRIGLLLIAAAFTLSFLAAALSGLRSVRSFGELRVTDAV